jgi:hypothetical protein
MRLSRVVFYASFVSLALGTGCGGCDSCFGTAQPGDYDATTTTATATTTAKPLATAADASVAAPDEHDGGSEAAAAALSEPVPHASSLPRPKAPMALGAFQICGNYDGPLCTKECPAGNCRQECDGVDCVLACAAGYCSQLCGENGKCKLTCVGGHCVQVCAKGEDCVKECSGGDCK